MSPYLKLPSILVDRILEWKPSTYARGIKNVSHGERWFLGHFPGMPVMPGMLLVEAIVQMGRVLARERQGKGNWILAFLGDVKFSRLVRPGDQVILDVRFTGPRDKGYVFEGSGMVNNERALHVGQMVFIPRED
jgi:3-hydroxyacyl-[acyl-carrier-protein] dehydratase